MKTIDEVLKFQILSSIKNYPDLYARRTMPEIKKYLAEKYETNLSLNLLYRWFKTYNFSYKEQKARPAPSIEESIKRTNQRIRSLGIITRSLCRELDIKHPSILDKLIEGIEDQFGTECGFNSDQNDLEKQIYESL